VTGTTTRNVWLRAQLSARRFSAGAPLSQVASRKSHIASQAKSPNRLPLDALTRSFERSLLE
jgi:hypothetical protein